jgi:hypothetical protein
MIVYLTGSSWQLKNDLPFLREAIQTIELNGGILARDWIETAFKRAESEIESSTVDWSEVIDGAVRAISQCDVVVVESSSYRFSQGYQVAIALQQKKPVLIISRSSFRGRSVVGIKNKLLTIAEYKTKRDLKDIISKFMRENTITTKDLRFNFFIDRKIYNYLRSVSYESGKNKSEIIRDLINREINRNDDL